MTLHKEDNILGIFFPLLLFNVCIRIKTFYMSLGKPQKVFSFLLNTKYETIYMEYEWFPVDLSSVIFYNLPSLSIIHNIILLISP